MIKSIEAPEEDDDPPRMLVLMCENDAYPALDVAGLNRVHYNPSVRVIPLRCLGSLNIVWIADALKILGNLSGVAAIVGIVLLLADRLRDPVKRVVRTYFDWFFIWTLAGVIATGAFIQFLRLVQSAPWMSVWYFVHLVLIFALSVSAPYTEFAHVAYRTAAMAASGRK